MKYNHANGIVKRDKKGHPRLWIGFFIIVIAVVYVGLLFSSVALNGWPIQQVDHTAKVVKSSRPKSGRDVLYIPLINLKASIDGNSIKRKGDPASSAVTLSGKKLGFGITPASIRQASPFFNLGDLKESDEIYIDSAGVRYLYRVVKSDNDEKKMLKLQTDGLKITAAPVGIVTWSGGGANLETF